MPLMRDPITAPVLDEGRAFLNDLRAAFDRAAEQGVHEQTVRIAGRLVRFRVVGATLFERMTAAFGHLSAPDSGEPALTVRMWDSSTTGVTPPAPPWPNDAYRERGEIRHAFGFQAAFNMMSGVLSILDGDEATLWVRDADTLPLWETAAPLRTLLGWWVLTVGGQLAHGAAVGTELGGVLLAARGGSGKSTTALSCLDAGMHYAGDDYVVLTNEAQPSVYSLYASAKLVPANLETRLPHLASLAQEAGAESPGASPFDKVVLMLHEHFADQVVESMPLRAIVVPHIAGDGRTALSSLSARDVLQALAPTTVFQLPGSNAGSLELLSDIVTRVPGYSLAVGINLATNVEALADLIAREARVG
ncbi:MAG: serine kinase [Rubricoccaceae bacterium]